MILRLIELIIVIVVSSVVITLCIKKYFKLRMNFILLGVAYFIVYGYAFAILRFLSMVPEFGFNFSLWAWRFSSLAFSLTIAFIMVLLEYISSNRSTRFIGALLYALGGYSLSIIFTDVTIQPVVGPDLTYYIQPSLYYFIFALIFLLIFWASIIFRLSFLLKLRMTITLLLVLVGNFMFLFGAAVPVVIGYFWPMEFNQIVLIYSIVQITFLGYVFIRYNDYFLSLFNIAYEFVVFHKSGILLFNYDFTKAKIIHTPTIKGAVLIGINHILSEFTSAKDRIQSIKLKDREIILEYNREFGFASLLIVKHRTNVFKSAISSFSEKFTEKYKNELESYMNLNTAIDTSAFENAVEFVREIFSFVLIHKFNKTTT